MSQKIIYYLHVCIIIYNKLFACMYHISFIICIFALIKNKPNVSQIKN